MLLPIITTAAGLALYVFLRNDAIAAELLWVTIGPPPQRNAARRKTRSQTKKEEDGLFSLVRRPTPLVLAQLLVFLGASTTCALLELTLGRASPRNQGWRYVVGVAAAYFFFEFLAFDVLLASPAVLRLSFMPRRAASFASMYKLGLTRIILISLCVAGLHRRALEDLYAITGCAAWGAMMSFHGVLVVDSGAHGRLAAHVGLPLWVFTLLNLFVVHGLPCVVVSSLVSRPAYRAWHGFASGALCICWGLWRTGGTLSLDAVYTANPIAIWYALFAVFVLAAAATPWLF